jgi:hypothetical protein
LVVGVEQVPHEFDFAKELENVLYLRECKLMGIVTLGLTHEYLDMIVLPEPIEDLCSPNVLVGVFNIIKHVCEGYWDRDALRRA